MSLAFVAFVTVQRLSGYIRAVRRMLFTTQQVSWAAFATLATQRPRTAGRDNAMP